MLAQPPSQVAGGELIRTIKFRGNRRYLEKVTGEGWQGRYRHDLSRLTEKTLITPNERFYIRTRCSDKIGDTSNWKIALRGAENSSEIAVKDLQERAKPMGVRLLECSGNVGTFGLLSAAEWSGVPLLEVLDEASMKGGYVLVDGFDRYDNLPENTLMAGCSWIYTREQIAKAGGFLATHMNGVLLPRDHGFPVRMLMPGWYGCTCVKWVQSIEIVDKKAKSTRHMREYSTRTQQKGSPRRARDFKPAEIDTAALPIRVEEWREGDKTVFRVIGIVWGGDKPVDGLNIHIGDAPAVAVSNFEQKTHQTWSLWTHEWTPPKRGRFDIWLTVPDESVRTRRLDRRYYKQTIQI